VLWKALPVQCACALTLMAWHSHVATRVRFKYRRRSSSCMHVAPRCLFRSRLSDWMCCHLTCCRIELHADTPVESSTWHAHIAMDGLSLDCTLNICSDQSKAGYMLN
jgi:hypothetical protein